MKSIMKKPELRSRKFSTIKDIKMFYISAKNIDNTFRNHLYQNTFISVSIVQKLIQHTILYLAHMSTYFYNISTTIDRKLDSKFFLTFMGVIECFSISRKHFVI